MAESAQVISPLVHPKEAPAKQVASHPGTREWIRHLALFLLTFLTTTFAGIVIAAPEIDVPEPVAPGPLSYILYVPVFYLRIVGALLSFAIAHPPLLIEGLTFSSSLLAILTAHEMGHYLACRRYGVNATLPFFIPAPPPLFLAGTFGAFIKMKSPIPSRRALFDIGLAGPLAGFVALLPFALAGVLSLQAAPPNTGSAIYFNDPLLFRMIAKLSGANLAEALPNPYYMAAWIGLLVTSLNLMPVGQLDGGHGTFSLFGPRAHRRIGQVAFIVMALIALLGFVWYSSPSGFVYTLLLAIMLRVRHPAPETMEPLGTKRIVVAIITLMVFSLSFWPFPITLG